jgi:hypothetical protein
MDANAFCVAMIHGDEDVGQPLTQAELEQLFGVVFC